MKPVVEEVAMRAWHFASTRLLELSVKDKETAEGLEKDDRQMLEFISRWSAGSLFIDLFTPSSLGKLVEEVFTADQIQTFVFDLRYHSLMGIDETDVKYLIDNLSSTLAPGFVKPSVDNYNRLSEIRKKLAEFDFADDKWKLTKADVTDVILYMPWLIPLLLIPIGGLIHGTNPNPDPS